MPTRNRTRVRKSSTPGTVKLQPGDQLYLTSNAVTIDHENCTDTTGSRPYTDHALTLIRREVNPVTLNGSCPCKIGLKTSMTFTNYMPSGRANVNFCPSYSGIAAGYYKTRALANMDPYKPVTDIPLFLFELKDMPGMVRDLGHVLRGAYRPDSVPGGYLAYSFGWRPLVSDVTKMFDFAHQTWQRCRYLRKLEAGTHIRRTLESGRIIRDQLTVDGFGPIGTGLPAPNNLVIKADVREVERLYVWFTCNAVMRDALPQSNPELRRLSRNLIFGLNTRPETVWNAIPWSWLVDYFVNVGDYMAAWQGLTHYKPTRLNVMQMNVVDSSLENVRAASGVSHNADSSFMRTILKSRAVSANPIPYLSRVPFLRQGQQAILGSLTTASALRAAAAAWRR